jgi:hypothetical protein
VKVRSLKVSLPGKYPILFTVSLPFFWALWLAAPGSGNFLRGLLPGSVLLAIFGVLSLVFCAIHTAIDTLRLAPLGMAGFLFKSGYYAVTDVIPHATPLLLALWLHKGLQGLVFSGKDAPPESAKIKKPARTGRGRYR